MIDASSQVLGSNIRWLESLEISFKYYRIDCNTLGKTMTGMRYARKPITIFQHLNGLNCLLEVQKLFNCHRIGTFACS
ncbi:hypothetical protein C5167_004829 [Papaver somniferum]|uniref:Uncharacterized protein n=1 Tax=Papaver somniferum TaxID=3469 RepID=A0A4Y7JD02_PAPSO|nr:hypothetical protein C5167_004829 [Papaver somniferum]